MLLSLLGLIDILAGFFILFSESIPSGILFFLGVIILIKGLSSIIGGALAKFFFDFLGWIDLIVGLAIIFSWDIPFLWVLPILKGAYCLVIGMGK